MPKGIPSGAVYNSDGTLKTTNLTDDEKSKILYKHIPENCVYGVVDKIKETLNKACT